MKIEYSGNIYRFPLDFGRGYAYAQLLDYSDVSAFDGILIQVFNIIDKEEGAIMSIEEIKQKGIMFGPAPINKYPKVKKDGWLLYGKDQSFDKTPPFFKNLRGLLINKDWATLKPWFKQDRFDRRLEDVECEYEEVRHLEVMILNHIDSIKVKITMMKLIEEGENVTNYYDLKNVGYKNLYLQVVNTYYEKEVAKVLLEAVN